MHSFGVPFSANQHPLADTKALIMAGTTPVNVTAVAHWLNEDSASAVARTPTDPPHATCNNLLVISGSAGAGTFSLTCHLTMTGQTGQKAALKSLNKGFLKQITQFMLKILLKKFLRNSLFTQL